MGLLGDPKCGACGRRGRACICASVARGHRKAYKRESKPKQYVVNANAGNKWCACGALIRDGVCSNVTCATRK